jgi:t-SNARE complex subunit (syntaxin)
MGTVQSGNPQQVYHQVASAQANAQQLAPAHSTPNGLFLQTSTTNWIIWIIIIIIIIVVIWLLYKNSNKKHTVYAANVSPSVRTYQ